MALIIAGHVEVDPARRDEFVAGHRNIVEKARQYPGCHDLSISPDPVTPGRVNIVEYWESRAALDAWRAICPPPDYSGPITAHHVLRHEIAGTGLPFD